MTAYRAGVALLVALCALLLFASLATAPVCHVSAEGRCLTGEDERAAYDAKADSLRP